MIANTYIRNSKSWSIFSSKLNSLIAKNKKLEAGKIFEKCVQLFLQTNPKYQSELKYVWLLEEVPKNIRLKLKLPVADEGIDLIAETYRKEYWAIQAKYKTDKESTLTRKDLSTFRDLAFVTCKNIIHGLVCSPISSEPRKAELMNKTGFALVDEWEALDDNKQSGWKAIQKKLGGKAVKPEKFSPKKHQQNAIKSVLRAFKDKNTTRGKMIMPCGTGKSLTAFWIARDMKVKNILVAIPSLSLLQQTLNVWTKEFLANNIRPDYLCICSDESAGSLEKDEFTSQTYDMGIRTTTDQKTIESFLKNKSNNIKIIFTTYQSGQVTAKASKKAKIVFDLGIMDEAHKTVGHKLKPMAHLIHERNIRIKKRLFMTATERVYKGGKENEILSMDDSQDYGNNIFQMTYKEAINTGIVSDYKIVSFNVTNDEYREIIENNEYVRVDNNPKQKDKLTSRELASALALRKIFKKFKISKAISFHSSITRADNFEEINKDINLSTDYISIDTFHVSSKQTTSNRTQQMRSFELSKKALMTNARCLTEGVDVPAIDCVTFMDSKKSKIDIVQAAGRAMRVSTNKKFGYILVPVITNNDDIQSTSKETEFDDLLTVISSLASTDERIIDEIKLRIFNKRKRKKTNDDDILQINSLEKISLDDFNKNIDLKLWDRVSKIAYLKYEDAKKLVQKYNIQSSKDYSIKKKNLELPLELPFAPDIVYGKKLKEWEGWGKFLGTNKIAYNKLKFLNFTEARRKARSLKFKSFSEYRRYASKYKKSFLPVSPHLVYKQNWKNMYDFLGIKEEVFFNFDEGQKYIRKYLIDNKVDAFKTAREIIARRVKLKKVLSKKFPKGLKRFSHDKKWKGERDFIFGNRHREFAKQDLVNYEDAKRYARSKKIPTKIEWEKFVTGKTKIYGKLIKGIPRRPNQVYKDVWEGWTEFLGGLGKRKYFLDYESARKLIKKHDIQNLEEYKKAIRLGKLKDLPLKPEATYKKDWKSSEIFFDTYIGFEELKKVCKKENINSEADYLKLYKKYKRKYRLMRNPDRRFKKKWTNWNDFLKLSSVKK